GGSADGAGVHPRGIDRRLVRFGTYVLIWTLAGAFFFTQDLSRKAYSGDPTPWWHYLVTWMLGVWLMAALTPVIVWLGRRWPIERPGWPGRVALHAAFSVAGSALEIVAMSAVGAQIGFLGALSSTSFTETLPIL